jgi:pseudaminic acid synthase
MIRPLGIGDRKVGPGCPVYIVAEMSANHGGDYSRAVKILEEAKATGADAVKLQTYTAETMTIKSGHALFRLGEESPWKGRQLYDLYREAFTPWEWQPKLKKVADRIGLDLFSSPFDSTAVDFLEEMGVPCYKIASFEIVDIPLVRRVARTGKPMILSTGLATQEEIEEAVREARNHGAFDIVLLKCTSAYPAPPEEMNLRAIPKMAKVFDVPIGLSDHTMGYAASVAGVAMGACIIEKHFTLSRSIPGPDSFFSLEPREFKEMVQAIRTTEKALGNASFKIGPHELKSRSLRRSLFCVENVKKGETLTLENVRSIRPGQGLPPKYLSKVLGRRASRDIERGTPLAWLLVDGSFPID